MIKSKRFLIVIIVFVLIYIVYTFPENLISKKIKNDVSLIKITKVIIHPGFNGGSDIKYYDISSKDKISKFIDDLSNEKISKKFTTSIKSTNTDIVTYFIVDMYNAENEMLVDNFTLYKSVDKYEINKNISFDFKRPYYKCNGEAIYNYLDGFFE